MEGSTATADSAGSSPNTAAAAAAQKRSSSVWALAGARVRRWCWEVGVLSRRSLLDLWRNPVLFLSHLGATTYFAGACSLHVHASVPVFPPHPCP